jgi:hypothetical protein
MHVYIGKLNWFEYAQNECITVVFPAGFVLKGPVCAYWQWTVDAEGNVKSNCTQVQYLLAWCGTIVMIHPSLLPGGLHHYHYQHDQSVLCALHILLLCL